MITIAVTHNSKGKEYKIFRGLLTWHSPYFAAALNPDGGFIDSGKDSLALEYSHDLFDAFYCWLYTGRLKDPDQTYSSINLLCRVWIFAEYHGIPELGNKALDLLHARCVATRQRPYSCIEYVWDNTTEDSKLRAFITGIAAFTSL